MRPTGDRRARSLLLAGAAIFFWTASGGELAATATAAGPTGAQTQTLGVGPAYARIGEVAVMHEGRIKPFDTVAREEVQQVYGKETVKLHGPNEEIEAFLGAKPGAKPGPVENWGPMGAFLGWTVRPEFWDDQAFILVDYLPLRRLIVAGPLQARLNAIAEKATTSEADKARARQLAADPEITAEALTEFVRGSKLPEDDRRALAEVAVKLNEGHKWLTPRELDEAKITAKDAKSLPFLSWASLLNDQQNRFRDDPNSAERPTEVERRAVEAAQRLMTYQAYSEDRFRTNGLVLIQPRPTGRKYLEFTARTIEEVRADESKLDNLPLMKLDALKAVDSYWGFIPREEHVTPTKDKDADERFTAWLKTSSTWVPLKLFLKSKPEELAEAGYPEAPLRAFLDAYRSLAHAEEHSPGQVALAPAQEFLGASRALGEAASPSYPSVASIEREMRFNAVAPFWKAPFAYGAALMLLAVALAFASTTNRGSWAWRLGRGVYAIGIAGLLVGIGLEIWGFYCRVRITGWAPVSNMYETVIWVGLVAAVLSVVFEAVFRPVYFVVAGSAVALLCTLTAANVAILDPSIHSLQPILRSRFWLYTHVLTEVSSYAAFGLAWMLGMIATMFYLTATYRRSPKFGELALILAPGLPLAAVGGACVAAGYGLFGPSWTIGDGLFNVFAVVALLGGMLTLGGVLALAGEVAARVMFRQHAPAEAQASAAARASAEAFPWQAAEAANAQSAATLAAAGAGAGADHSGGTATLVKPTIAEIRAREAVSPVRLDARGVAMQRTAATVKPLSNFIYRSMQVGVLLVAAGTILGGVWADYSWGRFWGWDAKEVWALVTLLVYLIPLHGRFAGLISGFGLVVSSVVCFLSVIMAWYGVNFVLGVGLHSYGFVEGGSQGAMSAIIAAVLAFPVAAAWRRHLAYNPIVKTA